MGKAKVVSIIIPIYNEKDTVVGLLNRVRTAELLPGWDKEIILVDDCSDDGTRTIIEGIHDESISILYHEKNMGKGGAIKTGLGVATGDVFLTQDADLEYSPKDYVELLKKVEYDLVYGSRIKGIFAFRSFTFSSLPFFFGGLLVSFVTSVLSGTIVTDESTGYKLFSSNMKDFLLSCPENGFDRESAVTMKCLQLGASYTEVPIRYNSRSRSEGKKISWRDGWRQIHALFKYRFLRYT